MVRELNRGSGTYLRSDRLKSREEKDRRVAHALGRRTASTWFRPTKPELIGRLAFLATSAYAFASGLRVYESAGIWEPAIFLGLILYAGAMLALMGAFWVRDPGRRSVQIFLASLVLVALAASVAHEISVVNRTYGTDAIAFAHVGAEVLLDGDNPYAVMKEPLAPIIERFGVPETFVTRTTSGDPIERLISYPAGHVLAYTGALAVGVEDLRWATLAFEVAALAVIWWALSPHARPLVPLVLLVEPNLTVYFTSGGVTDWLWVLPLVFSAIMLHEKRWGYAGLALGVACAIKQQPWFAVPFVIVWAFMHIRQRGDKVLIRHDLGTLIGGIVAGFLVVNLPFLIWAPAEWVGGVLSPISEGLVPDGQALSLLASRGFIPTSQIAFSVAMFLAFVLAIVFYYRKFLRAHGLLWVLPPALFLLSHRSLHNYFIFWIPVAALWLDLESGPTGSKSPSELVMDDQQPHRTPKGVVIVAGALLVASGVFGVYLASDQFVEVGAVSAEVEGGVVKALDVELTNTGSEPLDPVFELYWGRYPLPWQALVQAVIEPNESATIRIVPTDAEVLPPLILNDEGALVPTPFRVRVNNAGESSYASSELVLLQPIQDSVVNPEFRYWGDSGSLSVSPFGWIGAEIEPAGTLVQTRTLGSGRGASMSIAQIDQASAGWGEAALIQDVVALDSCYRLQASYDFDYSANSEGRPLAAAGLQILQGNAAAWFVLSDVDEINVTTLPEQTRIVEVPAAKGGLQEVTIELADVGAGSEIEAGEPGTIKLFSALHESQVGPLEFRVASIAECA